MSRPQKDFWSQVDKSGECWIWTGRRSPDGYGKYRLRLREIRAHRYAYREAYGELPDHLLVCHRCDTRLCVRPDHLFLGDVMANVRDMIEKGRQRWIGSRTHPPRKVNEQVLAMIHEMRASGASQQAISDVVGLSQPYVSEILRRAA